MKSNRPYEAYVEILYTYKFIIDNASSPEDAEEQAERLVDAGESGELVDEEVLTVAAAPLGADELETLRNPFADTPLDMRTYEEMDEDEDEEEEQDYY